MEVALGLDTFKSSLKAQIKIWWLFGIGPCEIRMPSMSFNKSNFFLGKLNSCTKGQNWIQNTKVCRIWNIQSWQKLETQQHYFLPMTVFESAKLDIQGQYNNNKRKTQQISLCKVVVGKKGLPSALKKVLSKLSTHCKTVVKKYQKICLLMYWFLFWRIFFKYHTACAFFNDLFSVWLHKQSLTICLHNVVEQLLMFLLSSLSKCWATAISNTLGRSWALYLILIHGPQTHS